LFGLRPESHAEATGGNTASEDRLKEADVPRCLEEHSIYASILRRTFRWRCNLNWTAMNLYLCALGGGAPPIDGPKET
jgi:hypothetical protein